MESALLDTDMLSELLKRRDAHVAANAAAYFAKYATFALSAMTRYEVLRGLKHKGAIRQIANFQVFCDRSTIFTVTDAVFERAADLWVLGERGGHPHRDADLLIAATALDAGRVLVTGNSAHFAWIPGLVIQDWRRVVPPTGR